MRSNLVPHQWQLPNVFLQKFPTLRYDTSHTPSLRNRRVVCWSSNTAQILLLPTYIAFIASDPLKGDLLCLGGAALYAISNVAQEFLVKNHSITEYLGLIGVSGSVVSGIQL